MNKKHYTETELKELMDAPPTEEEMEIVYKYFSYMTREEFDKADWH